MKFIHCSDIHWGYAPDCDKSWSTKRQSEIKETFSDLILRCRDEKTDFLFICGDLFDHNPRLKDLKEMNYLFSIIPGTSVIILGNARSDYAPSSPILTFCWDKHVNWIFEDEPKLLHFSRLHTDIHAAAPFQTSTHAFQILMTRQPIADASGFSYLASAPSHQCFLKDHSGCSGSLEPLNASETGQHGIISGSITEHGISLSFVPAALRRYIPLLVTVTEQTNEEEISELLSQEIHKRGTQNLYRIRLVGKRSFFHPFTASSLKEDYLISDCVDESEFVCDLSEIFAEHPSDVYGLFANHFQNRGPLSLVENKALQLGLQALSSTRQKQIQKGESVNARIDSIRH